MKKKAAAKKVAGSMDERWEARQANPKLKAEDDKLKSKVLRFQDGHCFVAGLDLEAETLSQLYESGLDLTHDQLCLLAEYYHIGHNGPIPTQDLQEVVLGQLQQSWYEAKGNVPDNVARNQEARLKRYSHILEKIEKGEPVMANNKKGNKKGNKKPKGEPRERSPRVAYEVAAASVINGSSIAEKIEDTKTTNHLAIIVQLLRKKDGPVVFPDLQKAVESCDRYTTKTKDIIGNIRAALSILVQKKLVKQSEVKA